MIFTKTSNIILTLDCDEATKFQKEFYRDVFHEMKRKHYYYIKKFCEDDKPSNKIPKRKRKKTENNPKVFSIRDLLSHSSKRNFLINKYKISKSYYGMIALFIAKMMFSGIKRHGYIPPVYQNLGEKKGCHFDSFVKLDDYNNPKYLLFQVNKVDNVIKLRIVDILRKENLSTLLVNLISKGKKDFGGNFKWNKSLQTWQFVIVVNKVCQNIKYKPLDFVGVDVNKTSDKFLAFSKPLSCLKSNFFPKNNSSLIELENQIIEVNKILNKNHCDKRRGANQQRKILHKNYKHKLRQVLIASKILDEVKQKQLAIVLDSATPGGATGEFGQASMKIFQELCTQLGIPYHRLESVAYTSMTCSVCGCCYDKKSTSHALDKDELGNNKYPFISSLDKPSTFGRNKEKGIFACKCGNVIDDQINAAKNIEKCGKILCQ